MYRRRLRRVLWRARAQHFDVITHVLAKRRGPELLAVTVK
jgi:hypothetical protein